jgi:uncharacterized protein YlxW (UPF0749 family)
VIKFKSPKTVNSKQSVSEKKEIKSEPSPPKTKDNLPRIGFTGILGAAVRWTIGVLILSMLFTTASARREAQNEAVQLNNELASLQHERDQLQQELDRYSDPDWCEAYWKGLLMRHKPGERLIQFEEPGA